MVKQTKVQDVWNVIIPTFQRGVARHGWGATLPEVVAMFPPDYRDLYHGAGNFQRLVDCIYDVYFGVINAVPDGAEDSIPDEEVDQFMCNM